MAFVPYRTLLESKVPVEPRVLVQEASRLESTEDRYLPRLWSHHRDVPRLERIGGSREVLLQGLRERQRVGFGESSPLPSSRFLSLSPTDLDFSSSPESLNTPSVSPSSLGRSRSSTRSFGWTRRASPSSIGLPVVRERTYRRRRSRTDGQGV